MEQELLQYSLKIFAVAILGGILPIIKNWSDELLHLFVSFGAGIFIGTVFLHLIPEAFHSHGHGNGSAALFMLIGFVLIFFFEKVLFVRGKESYDHGHTVLSITALVGLSLHSLIAGFGLAVGSQIQGLGSVIFISIIAHKATAAFSLSSLFMLAKMSLKKRLSLLLLFALMTPIGVLVFGTIFSDISEDLLSPLLGLTAGTFLYVAVGDLLPEVFHTKEKRWIKLGLMLLGIIIMAVFGHGDTH